MEFLGSLNPHATPIKYIIEYTTSGGDVKYIPLPYNPIQIRFNKQFATVVTPTLGRLPVVEHSGPRFMEIELQGRTGLKERRQVLDGGWWSPNNIFDGYAAFSKLYKALVDWESEAASIEAEHHSEKKPFRLAASSFTGLKFDDADQNLTRSGGRMVLRALDEQIEYHVEPTSFTWSRRASGPRFGYQYTLNLKGYGEAERISKPSVVEMAFSAYAGATAFIDTYRRGVQNLTGIVSDLNALVHGASTQIKRTALTVINMGNELVATSRALKNTPGNLSLNALEVSNRYKALMNDLQNAFDDEDVYDADTDPQTNAVAKSSVHDFLLALAPTINAANLTAASTLQLHYQPNMPYVYFQSQLDVEKQMGLESMDGAILSDERNRSHAVEAGFDGGDCVYHTVGVGESLYEIAEKYYNSRHSVGLLMLANPALDEMYASDAGTPGYLEVGSVLIVPSPSNKEQGIVDPNNPLVQGLFGIDLMLDEDGDLKIKGNDSDDIALIRGHENLRQGLLNKLKTYRGDNKVFPEIGLPIRPGDPSSTESIAILLSELKNQIVGDKRVSRLQDVQIVDGGDRLAVRCDVYPVAGGFIPAEIPI